MAQHYHLREARRAHDFENARWLTVQHKGDNNCRLDHRLSNRNILQHHQRSLHLLFDSEYSLAVRGLLLCLLAPEISDQCSPRERFRDRQDRQTCRCSS